MYRQILQKTAVTASDVPSLRYCMSAGEHLSDEILLQWRQRFGQDIYEAVGMSEFSYYLSHHPSRPLRAGSAGKPQPGHNVALLDHAMQAVADTAEGMLCIPEDDPGLFLKYWGLPEETAALRRDGFFLTGDYAVRDSDGYIWFRGRKDDIINSMGYRISPFEIERVLKAIAGVADCVAIDEAVASGAVIVTACIIAEPSARLRAEAVIAFAGEHLAAYKVPEKVPLYGQLPPHRQRQGVAQGPARPAGREPLICCHGDGRALPCNIKKLTDTIAMPQHTLLADLIGNTPLVYLHRHRS